MQVNPRVRPGRLLALVALLAVAGAALAPAAPPQDLTGRSREAWVTFQQALEGKLFTTPVSEQRDTQPSFAPVFNTHNFAVAIAMDRSGSFTEAHQLTCAHHLVTDYVLGDYNVLIPGDRVLALTFAAAMGTQETTELPLVHDLYSQQMGLLRSAMPRTFIEGTGTDIDGAMRTGYAWLSQQFGYGWRHLLFLILTDDAQDLVQGPSVPSPSSFGLPDAAYDGAYLFPSSRTGWSRDYLYVRWYYFDGLGFAEADAISFTGPDGQTTTTRADFRRSVPAQDYAITGEIKVGEGVPAAALADAIATAGKGMSVRPDGNGRFVIRIPAAGDYTVRVQHPEAGAEPAQQSAAVTDEAPRAALGQVFTLVPRGDRYGLAGTVYFTTEPRAPAAAAPVQVRRLTPEAPEGVDVFGGVAPLTDSDGQFRIGVPESGDYRVWAGRGSQPVQLPADEDTSRLLEPQVVHLSDAVPWATDLEVYMLPSCGGGWVLAFVALVALLVGAGIALGGSTVEASTDDPGLPPQSLRVSALRPAAIGGPEGTPNAYSHPRLPAPVAELHKPPFGAVVVRKLDPDAHIQDDVGTDVGDRADLQYPLHVVYGQDAGRVTVHLTPVAATAARRPPESRAESSAGPTSSGGFREWPD